MPSYVGLDISKKSASVCVMDAKGRVTREGTVESTPQAIVGFLRGQGSRYAKIGVESWCLSNWLHQGLTAAKLPIICIDARHAHGVLKSQPNKTDRADARGIASLMRTGAYREVHIKSEGAQRARALLMVRRTLKRKAADVRNTIHALLLGLGFKLGRRLGAASFESKVRAAVRKHEFAATLILPLLDVEAHLAAHVRSFDARLKALAQEDPVCQLLATAPGVGAQTALQFRAAIDDPLRFRSSRDVGAHLGLAPRTYQSGDTEWRGRISKRGDEEMRSALYIAAMTVFRTNARSSWLRNWGLQIAARRGRGKAVVAVARRLSVLLHRMWLTEEPFRWEVRSS